MSSEESQMPLNQRAFKRTAKAVFSWSQIIFDSYNKASGKQTTSLQLLGNIILRCSIVLQPDLCLQNETLKANQNTGQLGYESRICQLETIPEDWYTEGERPQKPIRVDHYWRNVNHLKRMPGCEKKSLLSNEGCVGSSCSWTWHCRG